MRYKYIRTKIFFFTLDNMGIIQDEYEPQLKYTITINGTLLTI